MSGGISTEMLVVLTATHAQQTRENIESQFQLRHIVSDRILVIDKPDAKRIALLRAIPGIEAATIDALPQDILNSLNQTEALWVAAWFERKRPKQRPGEGLAWDAPGFLPPDPPPGKSK